MSRKSDEKEKKKKKTRMAIVKLFALNTDAIIECMVFLEGDK